MDHSSSALQGSVWSATEGTRWHRRWAITTILFGMLGFLLPWTSDISNDLTWAFWSDDRPLSHTFLLIAPFINCIVLLLTLRRAARTRGAIILIVSIVFIALLLAKRGSSRGEGSFQIVGCFLLLTWAAAAAHSAFHFRLLARFRVPLILCGAAGLIVFGMAFSYLSGIQGPQVRDLWQVGGWFLWAGVIYAVAQLISGILGNRGTLRVVRWMSRLAILGIPAYLLFIALTFSQGAISGEESGLFLKALVMALKPISVFIHATLFVSLGFANLGDHAARARGVENFAVEVFD